MRQSPVAMQVAPCVKCRSLWPVDLLNESGKCSQCAPRKHRNIPTVIHGIRFASRKEAARYQELLNLHNAGEIGPVLCQPCFPIAVVNPQGEEVPICRYYADFSYEDKAGNVIIEDVKGFKTPVYQLKKKLVEALYGIKITEI